MTGQIIKIDRNNYYVSYEKEIFICKSRGVFRNKNIIPTVGDYCIFSKDKLLILDILDRINYFERPRVSNITQAFIVTSLCSPAFSMELLDRFLIILHKNKVKPIICITKEDLISKKELTPIYNKLKYLEDLSYTVVSNKEIDKIKSLLKDEVTVFTGQTGAGKSTLINKLDSTLELKTGEISKALGRGKHTTREVSLFEICGGKVLDTPGFSLIDFDNIDKEDIKESFIEFSKYPCKYRDCSHTKEEECSVKKAVSDNKILKDRYEDYIKFIGR